MGGTFQTLLIAEINQHTTAL